jgi:hypothetical protein
LMTKKGFLRPFDSESALSLRLKQKIASKEAINYSECCFIPHQTLVHRYRLACGVYPHFWYRDGVV